MTRHPCAEWTCPCRDPAAIQCHSYVQHLKQDRPVRTVFTDNGSAEEAGSGPGFEGSHNIEYPGFVRPDQGAYQEDGEGERWAD